ncbi:MAG: hypothetical protein P8H98_12045 [Flavobacteriales bacterium]|nr:hypothetical protein [Flavobacteriales bacterium]
MRIVNFYEHPADNRYTVFQYGLEEHADHFQSLLEERKIPFERYLDEEVDPPVTLFGVANSHRGDAENCNYLCHARYRRRMIPNRFLGVLLVLVTGLFVLLAIVGYIKSR